MKKNDLIGLGILGISEVAKLLLIGYFSLSAQQGKTAEQVKAELDVQFEKFKLRDPSAIPEV